jgi:hypothetical protein
MSREKPSERQTSGDAGHEVRSEPVYSLDDAGGDTDEAIKAAIVRDVVAHAERVTRAAELAKPMESYRARPMLLALLAIVSVAVAGYAYAARATWVFGPQLEQIPVAQREAHVRYAMYLTAGRILSFQDSTGSLPRTLREVGESWSGMSYQLDGSTFSLRARADSATPIEYRSTRDPRQFVGQAPDFLRERQP